MKTNYLQIILLMGGIAFITSCATISNTNKPEMDAETNTEMLSESQNQSETQTSTENSINTTESSLNESEEVSGLSVENAVPIIGKMDLRQRQKKEIEWIKIHYPGYRIGMHSMLFKRKENKWFDIVTIFPHRRGGEGITLYFGVEM